MNNLNSNQNQQPQYDQLGCNEKCKCAEVSLTAAGAAQAKG